MSKARFTTAIGTPLTRDEELHEEGLERELEDQSRHHMDGVLAAGSMGAMQLLTDGTYRRLIERTTELWVGKGELLVGAGDTGYARTRDRIEFLNGFKLDGVAVLAPYFWNFGQDDLISYFRALADISKAPVYLYDLPQVTGTKLTMETFLKLAEHPNIAGGKVSCDFDFSRQLIDAVGDSFRIIVAQPNLSDTLLRSGVNDQLEGVWAATPGWIVALGKAADEGNWDTARDYQHKITAVREVILKYGMSGFSIMMNKRGIPGSFAPRPFSPLTEAQEEDLLNEAIIRTLIEEDSLTTVDSLI